MAIVVALLASPLSADDQIASVDRITTLADEGQRLIRQFRAGTDDAAGEALTSAVQWRDRLLGSASPYERLLALRVSQALVATCAHELEVLDGEGRSDRWTGPISPRETLYAWLKEVEIPEGVLLEAVSKGAIYEKVAEFGPYDVHNRDQMLAMPRSPRYHFFSTAIYQPSEGIDDFLFIVGVCYLHYQRMVAQLIEISRDGNWENESEDDYPMLPRTDIWTRNVFSTHRLTRFATWREVEEMPVEISYLNPFLRHGIAVQKNGVEVQLFPHWVLDRLEADASKVATTDAAANDIRTEDGSEVVSERSGNGSANQEDAEERHPPDRRRAEGVERECR